MRSADRVFYNRNLTTASYVGVCYGIIFLSCHTGVKPGSLPFTFAVSDPWVAMVE